MRPSSPSFLVVVPALLWALVAWPATPRADDAWQNDLVTWRAQHAVELQKPDGWLALAGLEWIDPGDSSFGSGSNNKIHLPAGGPEHLGILHVKGFVVTIAPPAG